MEFVATLYLSDIEFGVESAGEAVATSTAFTVALLVGVEVIEKTEERVEGWRAVVVVASDECSWEDRHVDFSDSWKNCSFEW